MKVVQIQANIVLLAPIQDPTIVTKDWLIKNEILAEEPLDFVHTSKFSSVDTREWSLTVEPQRVIAQLKIISQDSLSELSLMMKKYVEKLPTVQFRAIGINSKWQVRDVILAEILKPIFGGNSDLFTNVIGEQPLVGGILLWKHEAFRVRLTAEPQSPKAGIDFNFHADVSQVDDLYERLDDCSLVMSYADKTANDLLGGAI
jgi:hypothetical protein